MRQVLRVRTLLAILGYAVVVTMASSWAVRALLVERFARLEEQDARQSIERALSALTDEMFSVAEMAEDYASWNDTYAYMEKPDPAFPRDQLPTAAHSAIRVHAVALLDTSGRLVFGRSLDLERKRDGPLPPAFAEQLRSPLLRQRRNGQPRVQGVLMLSEGPILVGSRPILTSENAGPSRGTLVMGRWLDEWLIEKLTRHTQNTLSFSRFDDPKAPADVQWARALLSAQGRPVARPRDEESISGYALIEDLYEKPALVLRVDGYRRIYKEGESAATHLTAWLVAAGLACGLASALLARRLK